MNEITSLIKGTQESSLAPPTMCGHNKKMDQYEPGSRPSPDTESIDLGLLASRL